MVKNIPGSRRQRRSKGLKEIINEGGMVIINNNENPTDLISADYGELTFNGNAYMFESYASQKNEQICIKSIKRIISKGEYPILLVDNYQKEIAHG